MTMNVTDSKHPWWFWPVCFFTIAVWVLCLLDGSLNLITFLSGN
jgi:hypothetical protein